MARGFFQDAADDFDSGGFQAIQAAAGCSGVWILHGGDDALDARGEDGFGAGAGASGVIARFERDVERRTLRALTCGFQRDDFCVIAILILMKALADNFAFADDDAADCGIRAGEADAFARQVERVVHEANVVWVHGLVEERVDVGFGVERNQIVDLFAGADETNGEAEFARDGDDDAAFGGAVELGEDDAGDARRWR